VTRSSSRAAALAAALIASSASLARAEHASVKLSYARSKAAAGCPDEPTFRSLVAARLGYDPFVGASTRSLVVEFQSRGGEVIGRLKLGGDEAEQRERTLHARSGECFELGTSMALVVAVALDPDAAQPRTALPAAATEPAAPAEPSKPAPAPAPAPAPGVAQPLAEPPREGPGRSGPALRFELGPVLPLGIVPAPRGGVRAGGGFERSTWSLHAEATYLFRSEQNDSASSGSVSAYVVYGSLVPCLMPLAGHPWLFEVCAVGSLGVLGATARGVPRPAPTTNVFAAVGPRAAVALMLSSSVGIGVAADVPVTLARTHLHIEEGAERHDVWTEARVGFVGAVVLVARLPIP
jgi:hypothetical protein